MFIKVKKVRIKKDTVASCFHAASWHVPAMNEDIQDRNRKYDQQSDPDSITIPSTYNCYQHTHQSTQNSISPQHPLIKT